MLLLMGNFSAKVGLNWNSWAGAIGTLGLGVKTKRGKSTKFLPREQPNDNELAISTKKAAEEVVVDITSWANKEHNRLCTCEFQMEIKYVLVQIICG